MSDMQTVWTILWNRAARSVPGGAAIEIAEVAREVALALHVDEATARRLAATLLTELSRLPEGDQFFALEGSAVVPLAELAAARQAGQTAIATYPYEL